MQSFTWKPRLGLQCQTPPSYFNHYQAQPQPNTNLINMVNSENISGQGMKDEMYSRHFELKKSMMSLLIRNWRL